MKFLSLSLHFSKTQTLATPEMNGIAFNALRFLFFFFKLLLLLVCSLFFYTLALTVRKALFHLSKPEIVQYLPILLRFSRAIKSLLAKMTGHISPDTLREIQLWRIKGALLKPILQQPQGYPLRWLTALHFFIFSLTKLDFAHYSLLSFVICSNKLYQGRCYLPLAVATFCD